MFVTRRDGEGNLWGRQHALDRKSVLRMMTRWGAEYVLKEDKIGTLEPGKYADLIVLSDNLFEMDPGKIPQARVELTLVGGKEVYRADRFAGGS